MASENSAAIGYPTEGKGCRMSIVGIGTIGGGVSCYVSPVSDLFTNTILAH
jgi:hypothetical protein